MTPADLRAIAARVMAGEDVANNELAEAIGYGYRAWCLTSLDAADLLMAPLRKRGWRTRAGEAIAGGWYAVANHKRLAGPPICFAPTGPRARTALALLCRAVELEHADADQR